MCNEIEAEPFVALRPSTAEVYWDEAKVDLYWVTRNYFSPTPESVQLCIATLMEYHYGKPSSLPSVEAKRPVDFARKPRPYSLEEVEETSKKNGCNILGGLFLCHLESFDIEIGRQVGVARVGSEDRIFMVGLYSDLSPYFEGVYSGNDLNFAQAVIAANTGSFKVVTVGPHTRVFSARLLEEIAYLKRVYRTIVGITIPRHRDFRDNLVHSPENLDEMAYQWKLFRDRMPL